MGGAMNSLTTLKRYTGIINSAESCSRREGVINVKFDIVPVLLEYPHDVTANRLTFLSKKGDKRTVMKQLEESIQKQIDG